MSRYDIISIEDLEIFAYHGVMPEENVLGQKFIVSVKMYLDLRKACTSDDISATVNYAEVCSKITEYSKKNTFKLIERLASGIADIILMDYDMVKKVEVEVKKPWAPIHLPVGNVSVVITRKKHIVYLSLGTNMGDRKNNLDIAIEALRNDKYIEIKEIAEYIETAPVGYTEQDDFLNTVVSIETIYDAHELLDVIHDIEKAGGRKREIHWGPRTIDVDIILFDEEIIAEDDLCIPHPEMTKREFVLKPLAQIAPYAYHPAERKNVAGLLEEFTKNNNI